MVILNLYSLLSHSTSYFVCFKYFICPHVTFCSIESEMCAHRGTDVVVRLNKGMVNISYVAIFILFNKMENTMGIEMCQEAICR